MNHHTKVIIEQISKYAITVPDNKKNEIFALLSDADNTISGEFFELYNNKIAFSLTGNKIEEKYYNEKLKEFFEKITAYKSDNVQEMACGDYKCVFANSMDIIVWLEDNCEDRDYGNNTHLPLALKSCEGVTEILFEPNIEEVDTLIYDWDTYKALKHFFLEYSKTFTRGAFDSTSLITLVKSDILDREIKKTYQNLINYIEYKQRTPKDQYKYIHAINDDMAKVIVDKDIEAIQDIIEHGKYDIFNIKVNDIDPDIAQFLSNTNTKYISLLKKIIGLSKQAEENDVYLQNKFPLSKKVVKGKTISKILLNYYKNNYGEKRVDIGNLLLDIQQQEILLWSRLQGHTPL